MSREASHKAAETKAKAISQQTGCYRVKMSLPRLNQKNSTHVKQ